MLISVILPVYNVSEYISKCLDSIISQSYGNLEIICVNDASSDNSLEILEEYKQKDKRIRIIKNETNVGAGESRNIGLKAANGEYVHFVDPDDWLEADLYSELSKKLQEFSQPDILYFKYNTFDNISKEFNTVEFKNETILNRILNPVKNPEAFDNWDRYAWIKLHKRQFLLDNNIFYTHDKALEEMIPAAIAYVNCKTLVYTDIIGINYRINRKGSLVPEGYKSFKGIVKAFEHNKKLYKNLPDNIKYRLLGFDYYQIRHNVEKAYIENEISTFELIKTVIRLNTPDSKKYIYTELDPNEYELLINLRKVLMRKHCPNLWKNIINIKKKLFKSV